jgi:hypothetical protein
LSETKMREELLFEKLGFEPKYVDLEGRKELLTKGLRPLKSPRARYGD